MSRKPSRPRRAVAALAPPAAAPPIPIRHPAAWLAIAAAAASVMLSTGYQLYDTDLWQLLVVGKAIWTERAIPTTDQWAWPSLGAPQATSSWGFRAVLWPVWSVAGVGGLFALRWMVALATFAVLGAAARRMGARGLVTLFAIAMCALAYRLRAEVRPESLAGLMLALVFLILEARRSGGADRSAWIPPIACVWANLHLSWYLGLGVVAVYALEEAWRTRRFPGRLALIAAAAGAACFVNPFGARALLQPFEFALSWRHEEMFRNVVELMPVNWQAHRTDGLPVLVVAWPVLVLWRWRRRGIDVAELLLCASFTAVGVASQRFLGFYALAALPFVARDAQEWVESRRWPAWSARPWPRATLVAVACLAIGIAEWRRPELPLRIGYERTLIPEAAADFMAANGVRGRAFNHFHLGGYLAFRGWPERDRLPFATTQPENIPAELRRRYPRVFVDRDAWRALERDLGFDYAVLVREQDPGDRLLDYLDADTAWALVFSDDAAQVLVRRDGRLRAVAERHGFHAVPAGVQGRTSLVPAAFADTVLRARAAAELERMIATTELDGSAHHLLGVLRMMDGRGADAREHLEAALARKPYLPRVHELLGVLAMERGDARDALASFTRERDLHGAPRGIETRRGQAYEALGRRDDARRAYERELRRFPDVEEARAGLARLANR